MRTFRFASILAVTLAAVAAGLSCGSSTSVPGSCQSARDCSANEICNTHGFCQRLFGCRSNADCATNQTCDVSSGVCLCSNDQACPTGQFCNTAKRCQPLTSCFQNADCPTGKVCNTGTKLCIPGDECGGSVDCPLGYVCDAVQKKCVQACNDSGDCNQTTVDGNGVTLFSPQGCVRGECQPGGCTSNIGCLFNQVCANNSCVSACSDGPSCKACTSDSDCNSPNSFCLLDPRNPATCDTNNPPPGCKQWCGLDCSGGQQCPSGFECSGIVVVTSGTSCTCGTNCQNNTGPCECQEGATSGICACRSDLDCDPGNGVFCNNGQCTVGANCFPVKGEYCDSPGPPCP